MRESEKFRSELGAAESRAFGRASSGAAGGAEGRGGAAALEEFRQFFFRSFPRVGRRTLSALFEAYAERRRERPVDAAAWLAGAASILMLDYDGYPFERSDWELIREAVALEEEELDMDLLEYAMSLVLDHGAL